jgi:hypothetical protein
MTRNDFIMNATADYLECLQDANRALEKCRIYGIDPITAYTDTSTGHIVDIEYPQANASQLEVLCTELEDQMQKLEAFYNAIYALTTAKNELESVDLYEFDEDNGAE